ncbi:MAG TPA: hypothetical protein HPP76_01865 [Desulfuromonadales bacterium]|nr:hypothetical protein [Desulfuromonadales bacterium]
MNERGAAWKKILAGRQEFADPNNHERRIAEAEYRRFQDDVEAGHIDFAAAAQAAVDATERKLAIDELQKLRTTPRMG